MWQSVKNRTFISFGRKDLKVKNKLKFFLYFTFTGFNSLHTQLHSQLHWNRFLAKISVVLEEPKTMSHPPSLYQVASETVFPSKTSEQSRSMLTC